MILDRNRQPGTASLTTEPPKLLVSVRDVREAELALAAGVDWIDLKDPQFGPLGAADARTVAEVASRLRHYPRRSAALGELRSFSDERLAEFAEAFPVLKIGLSGMRHGDWERRLEQLRVLVAAHRSLLVPVLYADWRDCQAPGPDELTTLCARSSADGQPAWPLLLVDTFAKAGVGLLETWTLDEVTEIVSRLVKLGTRTVLAGSLSAEDVCRLVQQGIPAEAIGVRGAVCAQGRGGPICEDLLRQLVSAFQSNVNLCQQDAG